MTIQLTLKTFDSHLGAFDFDLFRFVFNKIDLTLFSSFRVSTAMYYDLTVIFQYLTFPMNLSIFVLVSMAMCHKSSLLWN